MVKLFAVIPLTWTVPLTLTDVPVVVKVATNPVISVPCGTDKEILVPLIVPCRVLDKAVFDAAVKAKVVSFFSLLSDRSEQLEKSNRNTTIPENKRYVFFILFSPFKDIVYGRNAVFCFFISSKSGKIIQNDKQITGTLSPFLVTLA